MSCPVPADFVGGAPPDLSLEAAATAVVQVMPGDIVQIMKGKDKGKAIRFGSNLLV